MEGADGKDETMCIFEKQEAVRGTVFIDVPKGKKVEHMGVKVELIGVVGKCDPLTLPRLAHKCQKCTTIAVLRRNSPAT